MPTMPAAPARPARSPHRDFFELSQRVEDAGLIDRRLGWYAARAMALAADR